MGGAHTSKWSYSPEVGRPEGRSEYCEKEELGVWPVGVTSHTLTLGGATYCRPLIINSSPLLCCCCEPLHKIISI